MEFTSGWQIFLIGSIGAMAMEILKLYELRAKLHTQKYQKLLRFPLYWFIVLLMCLASGFFSWVINANTEKPTVWQVVISAIGAVSIIRKSTEANEANKPVTLGSNNSDSITFSDIFK